MKDDISVPVRTLLPAGVYARLYRASEAHGTTVGELVAELVRRALVTAAGPQELPRAAAPRVTQAQLRAEEVEQRREARAQQRLERATTIRRIHGAGGSDGTIAKHFSVSQVTASRWRRDLGLEPNFTMPARKAPSA